LKTSTIKNILKIKTKNSPKNCKKPLKNALYHPLKKTMKHTTNRYTKLKILEAPKNKTKNKKAKNTLQIEITNQNFRRIKPKKVLAQNKTTKKSVDWLIEQRASLRCISYTTVEGLTPQKMFQPLKRL
jgi:3-oxoacyl-[acyl-carrier-protein] synthase III